MLRRLLRFFLCAIQEFSKAGNYLKLLQSFYSFFILPLWSHYPLLNHKLTVLLALNFQEVK